MIKQSTKIAIDADGVIIYRAGFANDGADRCLMVFQELAEGNQ